MKTYNSVKELPKTVLVGVNVHVREELDAYMRANPKDQLDKRLLGMKPVEYFKILINGIQMNRHLPMYSERVLNDVKGEAHFYRYVKRLKSKLNAENRLILKLLSNDYTDEEVTRMYIDATADFRKKMFRILVDSRDMYYAQPDIDLLIYVEDIKNIPEELLVGIEDKRLEKFKAYVKKQTNVLYEGEAFNIPTINIDAANAIMSIEKYVIKLTSELKKKNNKRFTTIINEIIG